MASAQLVAPSITQLCCLARQRADGHPRAARGSWGHAIPTLTLPTHREGEPVWSCAGHVGEPDRPREGGPDEPRPIGRTRLAPPRSRAGPAARIGAQRLLIAGQGRLREGRSREPSPRAGPAPRLRRAGAARVPGVLPPGARSPPPPPAALPRRRRPSEAPDRGPWAKAAQDAPPAAA